MLALIHAAPLLLFHATLPAVSIRLTSDLSFAEDPPENNAECAQFHDMNVLGHRVGPVIEAICRFWPGTFPVNSTTGMLNMLDNTFGKSLLQWQALSDQTQDEWFCMRQEKWRPMIYNATDLKGCMQNQAQRGSKSAPGSGSRAALGKWEACEKHGNVTCHCTDDVSTASLIQSGDPGACTRKKSCYDRCLHGFKPTMLHAHEPVCTSVCGDSTHPVPCGVGCAYSVYHCLRVGESQVGEVANMIARVLTIILLNPAIAGIVELAGDFVDFLFKGLYALYKGLRDAKNFDNREEAILALLIGFFTFSFEAVEGDEYTDRNSLVGNSLDFMVTLLNVYVLGGTLSAIADVILRFGPKSIITVNDVAQQFQWQHCKVASLEVVFTIDQAGHEGVVGPWMERGRFQNRPHYSKLDSHTETMRWDPMEKAWIIRVLNKGTFAGKWLRWMGLGWQKLYVSKASDWVFPKTGWTLSQRGTLPVPVISNADDDGEVINLAAQSGTQ